MKWIEKHLNWTLILSVITLQAVGLSLLAYLSNHAPSWTFWLTFAVLVIAYYGVYDYILSKKGRKEFDSVMGLGWLFLYLTGWPGVIVLLLAKNRYQIVKEVNGEANEETK